jgi:hypothetical protein
MTFLERIWKRPGINDAGVYGLDMSNNQLVCVVIKGPKYLVNASISRWKVHM